MKERYEGFMRDVPCPVRALAWPEILAALAGSPGGVTGAKSIAEELSIADCADFRTASRWVRASAIAGQVLKEIRSRPGFLLDVGPSTCRPGRRPRCPAVGGTMYPAGHPVGSGLWVLRATVVHRAAPATTVVLSNPHPVTGFGEHDCRRARRGHHRACD